MSSRKRSSSRKGKEVVQENSASGSESDVPKLSKSKSARKSSANKSPIKSKPTPAQLLKLLKEIEFEQTRWADHQLLHELNIHTDVERIFVNIGLGGLFQMAHPAYKDLTHQFLATLSSYDDTSKELSDETRAYITFKINAKPYKVTMGQIREIFGFVEGETSVLDLDTTEAANVWKTISAGGYVKGASKANNIRHPAIRYAHKFLANTLFARKDNAAVKEDEMALLVEGIKPHLWKCDDGSRIIGMRKRLDLAHYLVRRFLEYQEWVHTKKHSTPQLRMGGLVTPILLACGVNVITTYERIERIDAPHLVKTDFLAGRVATSYGYRFKDANSEKKKVILPHYQLTTFDIRENLLFRPKPWLLYDAAKHGRFTSVQRKTPAPTGQPGQSSPEEVIGSARYHFDPYDEPMAGNALREAHRHISILQRWNKWQGKMIKKLFKKVNKLERDMEQNSSRRERRGGTSAAMEEDTEGPSTDARHSYHGTASASMMPDDAARASYYEQRPRRNRRRAPPSPSTSGSGNPLYSFDTSSSVDG